MKTIIFLKGGLVQDVVTDEKRSSTLIIDMDVEGSDDYDDLLDLYNRQFEAHIQSIQTLVNKKTINHYWKQYRRLRCGTKAKS